MSAVVRRSLAPRRRAAAMAGRGLRCAIAAISAAIGTALAAWTSPLAAQRAVTVNAPTDNPLRDGIPAFTIVGTGFVAADFPLRFTLQIATSPSFAAGILTDTTVFGTASGTSLKIAPRRLLPEKSSVYWRGVVTTASGLQVNSAVTGPRLTAPWLTLVAPNNPNGSVVYTFRPTFTWSSAHIDASAGHWQYEIRVTEASGKSFVVGSIDGDTTYLPPRDLEGNTSYRWAVSAWTAAGDSIRVPSTATFVVLDPAVPPATILFQNFPNPFPNERVQSTCIWFDLRSAAIVELQVLDIRGNRVRTMIPSASFPGATPFAAGRYGRASEGSNAGCDPRLQWDGTDDSGRSVPTGVYLIRLRAGGFESIRKALFKGR